MKCDSASIDVADTRFSGVMHQTHLFYQYGIA